MLRKLTDAEHKRINDALAVVEARTNANFSLVVVPVSDRYPLYPLAWGALLALVAGAVLALAWPDVALRRAFLVQAVIFIVISVAFEWLPLRLLLVPRKIKHTEARELARSEFAARTLADQKRRIDILFFVSLGERYIEIIAEPELHARVGEAAWMEIVSAFTSAAKAGRIADGFVAAVEACGALLECHKPRVERA